MTSPPMVSLQHVDKHFGDLHVLRDINLDIPAGQVVVLLGPSGSGKSTLCRTINRLEPIDRGEIYLDGTLLPDEGRDLAALDRGIARAVTAPTLDAVFTDAGGNFTLTNVPTGNVKVAIDGRTATNAPTGVFWPEMVMDATLLPGEVNTLMGSMGTTEEKNDNFTRKEVYLPRIPTSSLQTTSNTAETTVTVNADRKSVV